jgi:hypothetical protein
MQIYVANPLADSASWEPSNNFRVDYGFWNGQQLIVEIDGVEPAGYARDIRRDRMLRRAHPQPRIREARENALIWGGIEAERDDPFDPFPGIPF